MSYVREVGTAAVTLELTELEKEVEELIETELLDDEEVVEGELELEVTEVAVVDTEEVDEVEGTEAVVETVLVTVFVCVAK